MWNNSLKSLGSNCFFYTEIDAVLLFQPKKRIIESVFISVLDYGDVIYGNASLSTLKTLDAMYHSALRFITGDRYGTHHCTLYNKVGWPALSERRDFHWKILIYKTIIGLMPPYLASLISWNRNTVNTRSLSLLTLHLPHANTKLGKTAFCFKAPFIWNEVQKSLRLCSFISLREFTSLIICTPAFSCNDCYSWPNHCILLYLFYMHINFIFIFFFLSNVLTPVLPSAPLKMRILILNVSYEA